MAFKMKGSPMKRNFGIGTSPMKNYKEGYYNEGSAMNKDGVAYGGTKTWKEGEEASERHGMNLNQLVTERNKHDKGTNPHSSAQNKINQFLGSSKRHEFKASENTKVKNVETKKSDKNVVKNTETGDKDKLKTKYHDDKKTQIKKEKIVTKDDDGTKKTVVKYDVAGNVTKEKGYSTTTTKKQNRKKKRADNKANRKKKRVENREKLKAKRNSTKGTGSFG